MLNRLKDPRIMMIVSMAAFGTLGPFVRNITVSSSELALYRAVLASLLISVYFILTKQRIDFKSIRKEAPFLLLSGVAISWVLVSLCALFSLIPLLLYNGKRGVRNPLFTFLFYAAYPLHIILLLIVRAMRIIPPYFF